MTLISPALGLYLSDNWTYSKATGENAFDIGSTNLREVIQELVTDQNTSNDTLSNVKMVGRDQDSRMISYLLVAIPGLRRRVGSCQGNLQRITCKHFVVFAATRL